MTASPEHKPDPQTDPVLAVAEQLHELFLEYRDGHGYDEETAWGKACCEYLDAKNAPPADDLAELRHPGDHTGGGPVG